jgi:acetate kinase
MGTRVGDLDPGVVLYLLRQQCVEAVEKMLNHESGIVALSGRPNDVKAVREAARGGDERALLSLRVFTRSVTKAIGAFAWLLGGVDAIVFSGGIGEHDASTRNEVLRGLEGVGIELDGELNGAPERGLHLISKPASRVQVFVVPAQEDLMIAIHLEEMMRSGL